MMQIKKTKVNEARRDDDATSNLFE